MEAKAKTFTGSIEFTIQEVSDEHVVGILPVRLGVLNPFGVVHAGAILWFADVCASVLITGKREIVPGEVGFPLAVNLNAALLGNQKEGTFTATSRYVKKGRTLSVVRTSVTGDSGRAVADVTTSHILSKK
jgi:1,4-dihydroxy-2-naphthoyl-CoA hydrolase